MLKKALNLISQIIYSIKLYIMEMLSFFCKVSGDNIRVNHGAVSSGIGGPVVKLSRMQHFFPNESLRYNIIYSVSAKIPPLICTSARKRGVKIVQHINSIFHPAYRSNYDQLNEPFRQIYNIADHIVFGSDFAKKGTERYIGKCSTPSTIIYNAVDTSHFTPAKKNPDRFNILAIGVHYIRHRIEPLILSMPHVNKMYPDAKLIIAGPLKDGNGIFDCSQRSFEQLAEKTGVANNTEFYPRYTQEEAPQVIAHGDILVHLKHMDWTPNTVIEAMACGMPILHTGNGGLPEIVGQAGLSLNLPYDWDNIHAPEPEHLAEKIIELYELRNEKGEAARETAVDRFDLKVWVKKHEEIFEGLLNSKTI